MPNIPNGDITFRSTAQQKWAMASPTEHVLNSIQRLLYMTPGSDIYDPEAGLDFMGRSRRAYANGDRDYEYETRIRDQVAKYTDIVLSSVVCMFQDETLTISMIANYDSQEFRLQLTADPTTLGSQITRIK